MEDTLKTQLLHNLAWFLVTLGAINWGLVGLFDINLVSMLLKSWPMAEKAVYILIGVSGLLFAAFEAKDHNLV